MTKIAHIGDIHISGKNRDRTSLALSKCADEIINRDVNVVVLSGDVFDKPNIADRYATVGELQDILIHFLNRIVDKVDHIVIANGNHDTTDIGKSSLNFLKSWHNKVNVFETPETLIVDGAIIGMLPWINKGRFVAHNCLGMDKIQSDQLFNSHAHRLLGVFQKRFSNNRFANIKLAPLLFGHCDIQGTKATEYYMVQGGSFAFTENQLRSTGAKYVSVSHIHKRQRLYVGSLFQTNFGEEGNPQGFEIITVNDSVVAEEYIELDVPKYQTIEIHSNEDVDNLLSPDILDSTLTKVRFYSESAHNHYMSIPVQKEPLAIIEPLFNKRKHFTRTEDVLSMDLSDNELLSSYIKQNPLPDGVQKQELMEVLA